MIKLNIIGNEFREIPFDENLPTIEVTEEDFIKLQDGDLKIENGQLVDNTASKQKQFRIAEIKVELNNLSQDFIQAEIGAVFNDLDARKERFRVLHNELRQLLGKEPRNYLTKIEENDNTINGGE